MHVTLWNMLPSNVRSVEYIAQFHCHLQTNLYNLAYPPYLPHINPAVATGISIDSEIDHRFYLIAAIAPLGGRRPQHAVSMSAYLALSSARWYPSSSFLVHLSIVSPSFLHRLMDAVEVTISTTYVSVSRLCAEGPPARDSHQGLHGPQRGILQGHRGGHGSGPAPGTRLLVFVSHLK